MPLSGTYGGFSKGFSDGFDIYDVVNITSPLDPSLIYKHTIDDFNKKQEFQIWNK